MAEVVEVSPEVAGRGALMESLNAVIGTIMMIEMVLMMRMIMMIIIISIIMINVH